MLIVQHMKWRGLWTTTYLQLLLILRWVQSAATVALTEEQASSRRMAIVRQHRRTGRRPWTASPQSSVHRRLPSPLPSWPLPPPPRACVARRRPCRRLTTVRFWLEFSAASRPKNSGISSTNWALKWSSQSLAGLYMHSTAYKHKNEKTDDTFTILLAVAPTICCSLNAAQAESKFTL